MICRDSTKVCLDDLCHILIFLKYLIRFSYSEYIPSENDNDDASFEKEEVEGDKNEEMKKKDNVAEPNADDDDEFEELPAGDSEVSLSKKKFVLCTIAINQCPKLFT